MGEPVRAFTGAAGSGQPGKVLVAVSSARFIQLSHGRRQATGHFLIELSHPLDCLLKAGYRVEFASPTGEGLAIDPFSNYRAWFVGGLQPTRDYAAARDLLVWLEQNTNFNTPLRFDQLHEDRLAAYSGIFLPGGHAPMVDLWDNPHLGTVLRHFHAAGKPIAAVCHAPIALLSAAEAPAQPAQAYPAMEPAGPAAPQLPVGGGRGRKAWPFSGYRMCCYSDMEEMAIETMWRDKLPFKCEHELRRHGAVMKESWPFVPHIVADRELITGQGPTSAYKLGRKLVEQLHKYESRGSLRE